MPDGAERAGVVTKKGIEEFENTSSLPREFFEFSEEDLKRLQDPDCVATWHTHPKTPANLTLADYYAFIKYPHLKHYIVGTDGIKCYAMRNGALIDES